MFIFVTPKPPKGGFKKETDLKSPLGDLGVKKIGARIAGPLFCFVSQSCTEKSQSDTERNLR
jgi:hypothetical protein